MPNENQCEQSYGDGWKGEYPNCSYDPGGFRTHTLGKGSGPKQGEEIDRFFATEGFTGDVKSLGYEEDFKGTTFGGGEWIGAFDQYDPTKEQRLKKAAGIDVGQLETAWETTKKQLGETLSQQKGQLGETQALASRGLTEGWGQQRRETGAQARSGMRQAEAAGTAARKKSRLAFSGTAAGIEREARGDVEGQYRRGMEAGRSAYEQATGAGRMGYEQKLATGRLGYEQEVETGREDLSQGIMDISQKLLTDVEGLREDWVDKMDKLKMEYLVPGGPWDIYNV